MSKKSKNKKYHVSQSYFIPKVCHKCTEIYENFFIGSYEQAFEMARNVDILIPLDSLDGNVWSTGFRGEIWYYPISDFYILPDDVLLSLVNKSIDALKSERKIGLFCLGGHGRTGYVAAVILGKLGIEDPILELRQNYCEKAVETNEQIKHISEILGNLSLYEKYKKSFLGGANFYFNDGLSEEEWWYTNYPELKDSFAVRDKL